MNAKMDVNGLLGLVKNKEIIEDASSLVARLEYARLDENHHGLFRTRWASDLFNASIQTINEDLEKFDIEMWFENFCSKPVNQYRSSVQRSTVNTDWITILLKMELKYSGFLTVLNNILELEEKIHDKIAERAKVEDHYNFQGVNYASQLLRKELQTNKKLLKN